MFRKFTAISLILLLLIPSMTVMADEGLELKNHSKSTILIEADTGTILHESDAHKRLPPASMTKLMTLLLIMEAIDEGLITLDETITVSEYAASMGGSQIYLEPYEEMSVDDLLKAVAIASANDASVALAERIAVTEEAFVSKMNERAKDLGLSNTLFQNTTGLPADNHYSSAYDMAQIAKELLKHEEITNYTKIYEDYLRQGTEDEFWLVNTNKLVKFYQGVDGLKTGYTSEAKYCLTATAKRGDMRVIAVSMGAETIKERNEDITQMLDFAFSHYDLHRLFEKGTPLHTWTHLKAKQDELSLVPRQNVSLLLKKGESIEDITYEVEVDDIGSWPLSTTDKLGTLLIQEDGTTIKEVPLYLNEEVEDASLFQLIKRIGQYLNQGYKSSNPH